MRRKIYIDLDGVLADMQRAAIKRLNLPVGFQWPVGVWDVTEATGIPHAEFWQRLSDHDFWSHWIDPTPHCRDILNAAATLVGWDNMWILSAPADPVYSASGKLNWLRLHVPELADRYILTRHKSEVAGPGRILLDDKPENVSGWRAAGGDAVLVPARWNFRYHLNPMLAVTELQQLCDSARKKSQCGGFLFRVGGPVIGWADEGV